MMPGSDTETLWFQYLDRKRRHDFLAILPELSQRIQGSTSTTSSAPTALIFFYHTVRNRKPFPQTVYLDNKNYHIELLLVHPWDMLVDNLPLPIRRARCRLVQQAFYTKTLPPHCNLSRSLRIKPDEIAIENMIPSRR